MEIIQRRIKLNKLLNNLSVMQITLGVIKQSFSQKKINSLQTLRTQQCIPTARQHKQEHISMGQLLKSMVYGGIDGCTNILIIIFSAYSAGVSANRILIMAVSVCVGDGIVMGLGDYLSAKSEIQYIKLEQEREGYQVDNFLDQEKKEITEIYMEKGFGLEDSNRIAQLYSTNKKAFVNIMMLQELKLVSVDPVVAIKCGFVTFFSFTFFGLFPMLPYIITSGIMKQQVHPWIFSMIVGAVELFSLGVLKGLIIGQNKLKSGLEFLIIGAVATAFGYGIGFVFHQ